MSDDERRWFRSARLQFAGGLFAIFSGACAPAPREVRPASEYGFVPAPEKRAFAPVAPPLEEPAVESEAPLPEPERVGPAPPPVERRLKRLDAFYAAVDELRASQRTTSVRILWLGDSHTAADFMTHPIREHLVRLGGDGGPGYIRLGLDGYRHGAANVKSFGRWRHAPILPAQRTRVLDGVFGYGGIRTLPAAAAGAVASVRRSLGREIVWTVSARLRHGAKIDLALGEAKLRATENSASLLAGGIQAAALSGADSEEFSVHHVGGDPEVFGVFADYIDPGIVLDTVGINGARTATVLAWEPEQYVAQIRARNPDLLVLAFGTNEVFDQTHPDRYVEHNKNLVEMVRQGQPNLPCWIVGPPDSSTTEGTSKARVAEVNAAQAVAAEELGCAFTSALELMGGEGSFNRWAREKPAKARGDRIHFTIAGYRELGELLAAALIGGTPLEEVPDGGPSEARNENPLQSRSSSGPGPTKEATPSAASPAP